MKETQIVLDIFSENGKKALNRQEIYVEIDEEDV